MKKLLPILLTVAVCLILCTVTIVVALSHANSTPPADTTADSYADANPMETAEAFPKVPMEAAAAFIETPIEVATEAPAEFTVIFLSPDGNTTTSTATPGLFQLPACQFVAADENETFLGWRVSGEEEDLLYAVGDSILVTENAVVTAVFGKKPHVITFYNGDAVKMIETTEDSYLLPSAEAAEEGMIFAGWSSREDGPAVWHVDESIDVSGDINLYAVFEPRVCVVTFTAGEGNGSADSVTCRYDDVIHIPANDFTKNKSHLTGYTDDNKNFYAIGSTLTVKEDVSLTATYALDDSFRVRINDLISYGGLYRVDIRSHIDLDALVSECATHFRITWTQTASHTSGKCIKAVDIFTDEPVVNRIVWVMDHYEISKYTEEHKVFSSEFDYGTNSFSTKTIEISEIVETGEIYLYYKALAYAPGDVLKNEYLVDALFSIEVF